MSAVGRRYAQALMDGLGGADPEKVLGDLETVGAWLTQVPGLLGALENPGIPALAKSKLLGDLAAKAGFEPMASRFVLVAIANRRVRQWGELVDAFRGLCDEKRGVVRAKVRTARPLDVVAEKDLAMRLGKLLGRRVEIESGVSPALLGGVELRMGSTVYDGTVAGALKALHQDLVKG
jgi:F-type H+-transporting ATPase subunit delta